MEHKNFATLPIDEIGGELKEKVDNYYQQVRTNGLLELWERSYRAFYMGLSHGGTMLSTGNQGEYTQAFVNHYRSLLQHKQTLITKKLPLFQPQSINTDFKSQGQTILARGLLDFYLKTQNLDKITKKAVGYALRYGEGTVRCEWDATLGEIYSIDPRNNSKIYDGDVRYDTFMPIDVIRDVNARTTDHNDWVILRTYKNRYDLIAKYATSQGKTAPDIQAKLDNLRDRILNADSKDSTQSNIFQRSTIVDDSDLIPVYEFYHEKTPAVPQGRFTTFVDSDTLLIDGDLPYNQIPVYSVIGGEVDDSNFGYTVGFDLLPLQEAVNALHSAVITNQKTFAVQLIALPSGSNITASMLGEGLSVIFYNPANVPGGGKPESINLTATPQEVFNYIEKLEQLMETISGINSVIRGQPQANLTSGVSMALIASQGIEFSANLQQNYISMMESVGEQTINLLKTYAKTKRVAQITGVNNKSYLKTFTGEDINSITRVTVSIGNPLASTIAGKLQIVEGMMKLGVIKTPEQYLQVLETGTLESVVGNQTSELMLIQDENEKLTMSTSIFAIATDDHKLHIDEHKSVLASTESRKDHKVVVATLEHMQQHIDLLSTSDPHLLTLLGQQPIAPTAPQQQSSIVPGQSPQQGGQSPGSGPTLQQLPGQPPTTRDINKMPTNPLSGQPFNNTNGGLPQ